MARLVNRLNSCVVRSITTPGRHADGNGLYLFVSDAGSKTWVLMYSRHKKRTELRLGVFPAMSLALARRRRNEAAKLRAEGIDPKQYWRAMARIRHPAFGEVALEHIELREAGWKNEKHRAQWRTTLETYCRVIWHQAVDEVEVEDILRVLRPIWLAKPETASRVRGRIEAVLDAAKVRGFRTGDNPAAWRGNLSLLLPAQRRPRRHHPAMPFEDVREFFAHLVQVPGNSARALQLLILTAARTSEVLWAAWSEFDLERAIWTIPGHRMKAGKAHRVPLAPPAVSLLRTLPPSCGLVFPGAARLKPLSAMSMAMVLRRLGANDVTVHGFRSSFRDWAGEATEYSREIAELALAHQVGGKVERAYRRGDALERRREMMADWSRYVCSGSPAQQLDKPKDLPLTAAQRVLAYFRKFLPSFR